MPSAGRSATDSRMRTAAALAFLLAACVSSASAETREQCQGTVELAQREGIVRSLAASAEGIEAVVDADAWGGMDFTARLGMGATIECAIVDEGERLRAVLFRDHRTNRVLGRYALGKLTVGD